ncbi:MAG: hypothetical protein Q8N99_08920 [Nanoarchaeota archaeon]|nr:hypothetical protein [Nanoarchaeota archaeon]
MENINSDIGEEIISKLKEIILALNKMIEEKGIVKMSGNGIAIDC